MTFCCGSGSADPCLWLMNPDLGSGSCYFRHWPLRCQQETNFYFFIFSLLLLEGTFTSFFKDKKSKESQTSRNPGFSYYFCMMIEGSGSKPLTNGSGYGRPKNMWIRIRNTDLNWSEQTGFWARITSRKVYNALKINLLFPVTKYYWYVIYIYKFCIMFLEPMRWRIRLSLKIINNFVISRHRYMTGKSPVLHYKCHLKMRPKVFKIQLYTD